MKALYCKICHQKFESQRLLSSHIRHIHKLLYKNYYDKYIKQPNEGLCLICNKPTKWNNGKGYNKYCCIYCAGSSPYKEQHRKETNIKKFGVSNPATLKHIKTKIGVTTSRKNKNKSLKDKEKILKKRIQTNINKFGYEHAMQNKKCFHKCMKHQYTRKQYTLPSGNQIYLQGYEPRFLDFIFVNKLLNENEIVYRVSGILYTSADNNQHKYYPDFYIPKLNLIIEIKSDYSLKCDKQFKHKRQSCIDNGYNYICIVNNDFKEFETLIT